MKYNVIGLMSGTSLDGLDIANVSFRKTDQGWEYELGFTETIPYDHLWMQRLNEARELDETELKALDIAYGNYLSECVQKFINKHRIKSVDFISSHGHTVHHQPDLGITVQIGNGNQIAEKLKLPVVYDFRIQDVKLGGQGAPLVPIGDKMLFAEYDSCLNLGGFANISFENRNKRMAFDICPANIVLNEVCRQHGYAYDDKGMLAESGILDLELYRKLNHLEYYTLPIPKSLGIEWVQQYITPLIEIKPDYHSVLNTLVQHIVTQIAEVIETNHLKNVLITGGGAFNIYLINELQKKVRAELVIPNSGLIDYKEAIIFAFLGVLKWRGENNILKTVTGAVKDHSSGFISCPKA